MKSIITTSPEATFDLGRRMAESVESKAVFLLEGGLGSGKTVFAKGVAAGLGIDPREVSSPTFTLMCTYEGRLRLYHIDLYRIDNPHDIFDHVGLEERLVEDAVTVIEWADKLPGLSFEDAIYIRLTWIDAGTRRITIERLHNGTHPVA